MNGNTEAWSPMIVALLEPRTTKPRKTGVTAIIDKGLGPRALDDLLETSGHLIDHAKLGFGTTAALSESTIRRKVARYVEAEVTVYPGGTLLEAAWAGGHARDFIRRARELGFTGIEVSDGTLDVPAADRRDAIECALDLGLSVVTEVGHKDPEHQPGPTELVDRIHGDLDLGAALVTIEARESGRGTGIYDQWGRVVESLFHRLLASIREPARILWEAPQHEQQVHLILTCGSNVNLANIPVTEVLALESLRRGLRYETLRAAMVRRGPAGAGAAPGSTRPRSREA